jgi:hypothetical protein
MGRRAVGQLCGLPAEVDPRSLVAVGELVVEARRLVEANRGLQQKVQGQRLWRLTAIGVIAALAGYAWSLHALLNESLVLLRANTELMESGNALLRATSSRQQEMQTTLQGLRAAPQPGRAEPPRRRVEGCGAGAPGCDSSTFWVPGFPGPRVSTKRAALRPSS